MVGVRVKSNRGTSLNGLGKKRSQIELEEDEESIKEIGVVIDKNVKNLNL